MRQAVKIILLLVMVLSSFSFAGCTSKNAKTQQEIFSVLNSTRVNPNFSQTIGAMVPRVFHKYDITWEPYQDLESAYYVKISGSYCPNPDIPNLSMNGSITYLVNTSSRSCMIISDPNNISATFLVFIVN